MGTLKGRISKILDDDFELESDSKSVSLNFDEKVKSRKSKEY